MLGASMIQGAPGESQGPKKREVHLIVNNEQEIRAAYANALKAFANNPEPEARAGLIDALLEPLRDMMRLLYAGYERDQHEAGDDQDKLLRAKVQFLQSLRTIILELHTVHGIGHPAVLAVMADVAQELAHVGMVNPLESLLEILRIYNPGADVQFDENELRVNGSPLRKLQYSNRIFLAAILHLYGVHFYPNNDQVHPAHVDDLVCVSALNNCSTYSKGLSTEFGSLETFKQWIIQDMIKSRQPLEVILRFIDRGFLFTDEGNNYLNRSSIQWALQLGQIDVVRHLELLGYQLRRIPYYNGTCMQNVAYEGGKHDGMELAFNEHTLRQHFETMRGIHREENMHLLDAQRVDNILMRLIIIIEFYLYHEAQHLAQGNPDVILKNKLIFLMKMQSVTKVLISNEGSRDVLDGHFLQRFMGPIDPGSRDALQKFAFKRRFMYGGQDFTDPEGFNFLATMMHIHRINFYPQHQHLAERNMPMPTQNDAHFLRLVLAAAEDINNYNIEAFNQAIRQNVNTNYAALNNHPGLINWLEEHEVLQRVQTRIANTEAQELVPSLQRIHWEAELAAAYNNPGVQRVFAAILFLYVASYFYGSFSY